MKTTVLLAAFVAVFAFVATLRRTPDLSHVNVAFLSGSKEGNYYAIVDGAAKQAAHSRGRIVNMPSAGSIENIARLAAATSTCDVQFALVQEGLPWPDRHPFELIGRLPVSEAFVLLGRDADRIRAMSDLRGKRVGTGPPGSGTEHVAARVLEQLAPLGIEASAHPLDEQVAMLADGRLDLGAMVIDPDAALILGAVRERKLQIVDISGAEALAHRLPSARAGVIKAGYYDPIAPFPPTDKRVIKIDTLIIGNDCARGSVTQGVITAVSRVFPDFVRVNREQPNLTGLEYAPAARSYFDGQGPDPVGEYTPWIIDIMPTARWLQLIFGFSLLFGAQALWHRFRLWRLDANRVRIEEALAPMFPPGATVGEIAEAPPSWQATAESQPRIDTIVGELERLRARCRRQSLSIIVPMGQEMGYRYQEGLIADLLHALRQYRRRLEG